MLMLWLVRRGSASIAGRARADPNAARTRANRESRQHTTAVQTHLDTPSAKPLEAAQRVKFEMTAGRSAQMLADTIARSSAHDMSRIRPTKRSNQ